MNTKELTIKALEENIANSKTLPKRTLIDTGRKVPEIEGDITGLARQVMSITLE